MQWGYQFRRMTSYFMPSGDICSLAILARGNIATPIWLAIPCFRNLSLSAQADDPTFLASDVRKTRCYLSRPLLAAHRGKKQTGWSLVQEA